MSLPVCTRSDAIKAFAEVAEDFSETKAAIQQRERHFHDAVKVLESDLKKACADAIDIPLSEGHPLASRVKEYVGEFERQNKEWLDGVIRWERNTQFREKFDDSFLVFVYGKVKSGKSSLGNYIAWGEMEPTTETMDRYTGPHPNFEVHAQSTAKDGDLENEAKQRRYFKVGETETTSSIQTFSIPGLTWVDSPGIHSMQGENGKLAKDYVSSADLVVYTMSSAQPGRRSDLEEICQLLEQQKPLVVLLTRSDTTDEDLDENGDIVSHWVMKPLAVRQEQKRYVEAEFDKLPEEHKQLLMTEVMPISVECARANENSPQTFIDSGMSHFLGKMCEIAKGDSVDLKKKTPLNNLKNFGQQMLQSQSELAKQLTRIGDSLKEALQEINTAEGYVTAEVKRAMSVEIGIALDEHRGDSTAIQKRLNAKLQELVVQHSGEELAKVFKKMDESVVNALVLPDVNLPGFQDVYKEVSVSDSGKKRAIGGGLAATAAGVAIANFWNPAGWGAAAVAAAAAATMIAGAVGSKVGESFASDETHQVRIGDNIETVEQEAHNIYPKLAEQLVHAVFTESVAGGFTAIQNFVKDSQKALDDFGTTIKEKVVS